MNSGVRVGPTYRWQWRLAGWINLAVGVMGLVILALTQPLHPHLWGMFLLQALGPAINFLIGGFCPGKGY